ncbi:MAG: hypothetical protein H0X73_11925 [Chthoniobacterales bacterium]|nr:hypothetical protein [Chthoniobacterales bacterium]
MTATETGFLLSANAYGTQVNLGNVVKSGPTAKAGIGSGCGTTQTPAHSENTVLTVDLPLLVNTGVINTDADGSTLLNGTLSATATADTHDAIILGGLIRADEVKAVSTITRDAGGFHTSAAGSELVNLVVAGNLIAANAAPNTKINLAGFGYVVINEQIAKATPTKVSLTVNMIHVFITQTNALNISVGTQIIVSHAFSSLAGPGISGTLDGTAYGTKARVGTIAVSGPTAQVSVGCLGTNGVVKQNEIAQVQVPNLFSVGAVVDTAQGSINSTSATAETTSTVNATNVLSGLVQASLIKADAHSSKTSGNFAFSDAGSSFVGLSVRGFAQINDNVAPNTKLTINGLGTLWLHRVIQRPNSIEVRMIELIITQENTLGLKIGTTIQIARAEASAH